MEKETILLNVESLTAEQLFEEIKSGNISLEEIKNTGELETTKRKKIENLIAQEDSREDEVWERARYGNELALSDYITNFPSGKYVQDAKEKIQYLEQERNKAKASKYEILDKINRNSNQFDPDQIKSYIQNGIIDKKDLLECRIPQNVIDTVFNMKYPKLMLGETPTAIPDGFTEVYFWGIPGSGKTCALAALLSTAEREGFLETVIGPGFDYMTRLKNIFLNDVAVLPGPTPFEKTQYLPFALKKPNEKYSRSVSLIELSGELFQCFYSVNSRIELPSDAHKQTLNSLNNFLKGKNRKIHFFFIDYESKNKMNSDGLTQANYLSAASAFFNKSENNFFSNTTDAIYIVLTKSDLMPCSEAERVQKAKEYLNSDNFSSFVNNLKNNCRKFSINGGILTVEPFTLGKIYFQQLCEFNDAPSQNLMSILFDRVKQDKKSLLDIFNK
jgi:hypothetical protein